MYDELRATGLVIGAVVGSLLLLGVVAALALARKKRCRMKLRSMSFARTAVVPHAPARIADGEADKAGVEQMTEMRIAKEAI